MCWDITIFGAFFSPPTFPHLFRPSNHIFLPNMQLFAFVIALVVACVVATKDQAAVDAKIGDPVSATTV